MSIYDLDTDLLGAQLLPVELRQPRHLAWLKVLLRPTIQYAHDLFFNSYISGSPASAFVDAVFYTRGARVIWTDSSVYEFKKLIGVSTIGINGPTGDAGSSATWRLVQDIFIGVNERIKYNSQIMVLEYALNRYYQVPTTDPQLYIGNNISMGRVFTMGNTGPNSSSMPNNSVFQINYLWNTPSFTAGATNFTVYVPSALLATLGATLTDQENNVRQFIDKYKLAGITYNVASY